MELLDSDQLAIAQIILKSQLAKDRILLDLKALCFTPQLNFIQDPSPFKTAVCSRRSGKTIACALDLLYTAITREKVVCLYITLSRLNAKRIIWEQILEFNRVHALGGVVNETDLSLKFPQTGSTIYLSGAKDKTEIEKFRGLAIAKCYIDECQSFRSYIQGLIDEVIAPALFDYNGQLCLIGTPGPVPAGYFYECAHSEEWSHHSWTMFENPWLQIKSGKTPQELLDRELKRKGIDINNATIQRECFAKWDVDLLALVFKYERSRNHYQEIPAVSGKWEYVIGVDVGFDDSDAICVLGWNSRIKELFLIDEDIRTKQGISELAERVDSFIRKYNPLKIVMDTGGLGKKIAEEMRKRYSIPIHAAEKSRKFEYIELLNDALRTSKFFAKRTSRFAQDCALIEWDDNIQGEKLKISDQYHSDITDAVLYAFRECMHWLFEEPKPEIKKGTPAWFLEQEKQMEEMAIQKLIEKNDSDDDMWGDYADQWNE